MKRILPPTLSVLFVLCFSVSSFAFGGDDWKPIDPAELTSKTAVVEKDADAEALFWEVHVSDDASNGTPRTVMVHYVRIKVFNERGRESQSKIDIPFLSNWEIKDIAARTIKPDGTIVELKKEDVLERTLIKASGLKVKAKSFAMPGVEPGCIIEYRWRELHNDRLANYIRLRFQRDVPVQVVKYWIKPLSLPGFDYGMKAYTFHTSATPFVKEKDGFYSITQTNVPAYHDEPHMPPEDSVRPWMLVYYSQDDKSNPDKFWKEFGKTAYEVSKSRMKVNDDIKTASASTIAGAETPEAKLAKLFEFCRSKIKNINDDASGLTSAEREKLKENKSPSDTLKRGMGTGSDIDFLFAALASAAGFDVRIVRLGDRSDIFTEKDFPDDYFMGGYDIAVKVGDQWRYYDPASTYVPLGMLRWQEEYQPALLADPKEPTWVTTPLSPPENSKVKRTAKLTLSEDGTIEGDVHVEYTGHLGVEKKESDDADSTQQREDTLRESVKSQMSTAELTDIKVENVTDPIKPFTYIYHVRVPGYAQRTGKRLFVQPAFFEHGLSPMFSSSSRTYEVYFHYPWSEEDEVSINLPPGFSLDNAERPASLSGGAVADYKVNLGITSDQKTLIYTRKFFFGAGNNILFPVSSYSALKTYFDALQKQDGHTLSLKQAATSASN